MQLIDACHDSKCLAPLELCSNIGLCRNADGQVLSLFKSSKRATILQSILEKVISVLLSRRSRRNAWINQCWCTLLTSLLCKKKKAFGRQHQGEPEFYSWVLKKLSQCCSLESSKKKCMDKSVLMYFANRLLHQKKKKAFGRQHQG